jgi:glycerophosphoryl diester phosphodiesterase
MTAQTCFIAHRGSSLLAPENTLASLKLGWEETTICEVDVQPTRDGKLLVIHDDSTLRTTGVQLAVAEHTLSELQQLDAGSWKGSPWKGERLPSLEEAISAMPKDKRLLVEIKAGPEVITEFARIVRESGKEKQLLMHSFSYATCVAGRKELPRLGIDFLITSQEKALTRAWSSFIDEAIARVKEAGLDGIGANLSSFIDAATVARIHGAGLRLNIWTVDELMEARRLVALGVDGIITNRPGWLKSQVNH